MSWFTLMCFSVIFPKMLPVNCSSGSLHHKMASPFVKRWLRTSLMPPLSVETLLLVIDSLASDKSLRSTSSSSRGGFSSRSELTQKKPHRWYSYIQLTVQVEIAYTTGKDRLHVQSTYKLTSLVNTDDKPVNTDYSTSKYRL